jgi:carbon-monoxide dehydrogenase large subunit
MDRPSFQPAFGGTFVGRPVPRLEDLPLLTGSGRYAADISFPHELHMRAVRSSHAHGRIVSIDASGALAAPGCVAVWTAGDVAGIPPIDFRPTRVRGLEPYRQPILATDRVRYAGEPVAVVFAEDAYLAEDAADLVVVEVQELPALLSADEPPGEFEAGRDTEPAIIRKGYGDIEAAFRAAHVVVELDLSIGRHSGVPLETRGAIARYDAMRDVLELHGATKRPHANRELLARMLAREPSSIHLYEGHVGGGFGVRGEIYPEDVLVCAAALRLGRPVKWIEDRRENLMACNHSRQQRHRVRAAVDDRGRILAIDDEFFHDQGAYVRTHGARVADMTAGMLPGPYRVPAYRAVGHYRLTNKTPAATYRAPGRYEATFVCERLLDAIAAKIGIDRVEVRRRNLIAKTEMPYARDLDVIDTEVVLDSGDYAGLLDQALARAGWPALQRELETRRAAGEAVGAGLAFFVEKSGLGPVDGARVSMAADGTFDVVTGAASLGQGVETVLAQIAADALGVDYRRVRVVHGQTDRIEQGYGSHASRTTVMTGSAVHIAATKLRENMQPGCSAQGSFRSEHMTYPYGAHIAVVKVDRETGGVEVERYLAAFDVGRAVNPMLVEGQIVGGVVQGLGGALFEEFVYDAQGSPLSVTFADYMMPTAHEAPNIDVLLTEDAPTPLNPLGIKGAGEGGITAVGAAIASAIDDAIGAAGAVTRLPVTPLRLKEILNRASR